MNPNPTADPGAPVTGIGYLRIRVFTGDEALPLEGAQVVVRDVRGNGPEGGQGVVGTFRTDRDGLIPRLALPAPPKSLSEQPGNAFPYARYDLDITLPGYESVRFVDVPVFDTVESIQLVPMIPLSESGRTDEGSRVNRYRESQGPYL
jgi:hypothetical protein